MYNRARKSIVIALFAIILIPTISSAAVYFITKPDIKYQGTGEKPCFIDGYTLTGECKNNKTPYDFCPSDDSFYRACRCDATIYKYDTQNCTNGAILSGKSCEDKYESCGCPEAYKYDSTNCSNPKELSGKDCEGKYLTCLCPSSYNKSCQAPLVGADAQDCDGMYTTCKCPSNYLKCDNGGEAGASSCSDDYGTKYTKCKTASCEDEGLLSKVPTGQECIKTTNSAGKTCYKDCKGMKYTLTNTAKTVANQTVYQIVSIKDFTTPYGEVKTGDLGGYVENSTTLSQEGTSWMWCKQDTCPTAHSASSIDSTSQIIGDVDLANTTVAQSDITAEPNQGVLISDSEVNLSKVDFIGEISNSKVIGELKAKGSVINSTVGDVFIKSQLSLPHSPIKIDDSTVINSNISLRLVKWSFGQTEVNAVRISNSNLNGFTFAEEFGWLSDNVRIEDSTLNNVSLVIDISKQSTIVGRPALVIKNANSKNADVTYMFGHEGGTNNTTYNTMCGLKYNDGVYSLGAKELKVVCGSNISSCSGRASPCGEAWDDWVYF